LASVALPAYQNYMKKARFTEVIMATSPYKLAIELCVQTLGTLAGCNNATNGVPANITGVTTGYVASVTVTDDTGVITAAATENGGLDGETYIITPTVASGRLVWSVNGNTMSGATAGAVGTCVPAAIC
jgi:type IV pilus assembly protein PilA